MKKKIEWSDAELAEIIKSVDAEAERVIAKKEEEESEKEEEKEEKKKKKESEESEVDKSEETQIEELYSSMDKNEAETHYSCLKKVLFGKASEEAPVVKSEESSESNKEVELVKSENETLKKNIEAYEKVIEVLKRKVSAPIQKAVTGLDYIKKSDAEVKEGEKGQLTKSEIDTKLNEVIKSDISGSDRNKINQFYLGKGSFETIKHLVTK